MGKLIDITNKKFKRLTVISKSEKRNAAGQVYWNCICECGKTCEVSGTALRTGHTKSCGCYNLELTKQRGYNRLIDIVGHKFGKLTVEKRADNYIQLGGQQKTAWICKCDCGNECVVTGDALKSGKTKSCGCLRTSFGEYKIEQILLQEGYIYEKEFSFQDCKLPSGKLARFDFYVNKEFLIEFDGKQHFEDKAGWDEPLRDIQTRDLFKNDYCLKNNYKLYRIPYFDIDKINSIEDIIQNKYLIQEM